MHPLQGLKVVELARILAGPWIGQSLADLGAEVVKVESPEGDDTRRWGPPFIERDGDRSAAYFYAANRGKTSVVADFATQAGRDRVIDLVRDADILIENFKVGGLAKFGLDYASLSAVNPRLIYCSISGFGQTGPYAARPGYDFLIQGMSGLMSITGAPDGQPQKVGVAITDVVTGLYGTIGILAAVEQRHRTGRGQHVDMSLLDCATVMLANQTMNYLATGTSPTRLGNEHPNIAPYQVVPTRDGHIILAVGNDGQFGRFCGVVGLEGLPGDPQFATNSDRLANRGKRKAIGDFLSEAFPDQPFHGRFEAVEHHIAHMSSAFHVSPFKSASVVSVDGFGDFSSAAWGLGQGDFAKGWGEVQLHAGAARRAWGDLQLAAQAAGALLENAQAIMAAGAFAVANADAVVIDQHLDIAILGLVQHQPAMRGLGVLEHVAERLTDNLQAVDFLIGRQRAVFQLIVQLDTQPGVLHEFLAGGLHRRFQSWRIDTDAEGGE